MQGHQLKGRGVVSFFFGGGERVIQHTAPGCTRPCRLPLAFELLHDLQEAVVGGRVAAKADLHLVKVGESVLHLRGTRRPRVGRGRTMRDCGTGLHRASRLTAGFRGGPTRATEGQRPVPRGLGDPRSSGLGRGAAGRPEGSRAWKAEGRRQ